MTPSGIQLFQLLKPNLGERATEALIDFVDTKAKENKHEMQDFNLKTLATKADLLAIKEELWSVKAELKGDIAKLDVKISDVKSDVMRWIFAIFVALMLAILGLYFKH